MKIWIDILTPKQVNFLGPLSNRLQEKGHEVTLTTRNYREANEMLERAELNAVRIGRHGGADLREKLFSSTKRIEKLIPFIEKIGPNICASFSSPEAARVAFGLGIPHLCVSDSPHAEAASRLTIPLSKTLFAPAVIPMQAWAEFGITRQDIVRYDALDPVIWLRKLKPNPKVLDELGLDRSRQIAVLRSAEFRAAYLYNKVDVSDQMVLVGKILVKKEPDLQIVLLPRYDCARSLRRSLPRNVIVPSKIVDSSSLLFYSDLFVGAGGTMTAEAALLGVASISCYPSEPTYVDKYLIRHGLVKRETRLNRIISESVRFLRATGEAEKRRRKARAILNKMEDPLACIEGEVARLE